MKNDYTQNTKSAFNAIAAGYDAHDNQNPILQWMRKLVHGVYLKYIPEGSSILELNAGTGVDAVFLAEQGYNVFATDISEEMIKVLMSNAKAQMSNGLIKAEVSSFGEITQINEKDFDAVVSNFGGLNCINDFSKLSGDLAAKLKPNGLFIAVVMNKICPWEIFYYIITLKFGEAFRRFKKHGIMAELNGEKVLTYYFTPGEFTAAFSRNFTKVKLFSLGLKTPPPYLLGIYNRFKPLVKIWMKLDEIFMGLPILNLMGDHFIIVMKKK
ncbi:MAG TPA: class I SAM-dependent methyltransferase [Ignavibacteria bacterium]|nr:class I SAM-dependent methyltransferase [Ignavibacteria bacterium]HMQ98972.1 class I SAM-dependent methyltransferase [Ignavibacteria bacterium]